MSIVVSAVAEAPLIGNHWWVAALVSLGALLARPWSDDETAYAARFFPTARLILLTFYSFAAFAKLNTGFLDPVESCARFFANQTLSFFQLPEVPGGGGLPAALAWITLVIELAVPVLLIVRRTRRFGVWLAVLFHLALTLDLGQHFYDFTLVLVPLFALFAPPSFLRAIDRALPRSRLGAAGCAMGAGRRGPGGGLPPPPRTHGPGPGPGAGLVDVGRAPGRDPAGPLPGLARWRRSAGRPVTGRERAVVLARVAPAVRSGVAGPGHLRAGGPQRAVALPGAEVGHGVQHVRQPRHRRWRDQPPHRPPDRWSAGGQGETVEILESDDDDLASYVDSGFTLPVANLADYLVDADHPETTVTYRLADGTVETAPSAGASVEPEPMAWWAERPFLLFRAVPTADPPACQNAWLPALGSRSPDDRWRRPEVSRRLRAHGVVRALGLVAVGGRLAVREARRIPPGRDGADSRRPRRRHRPVGGPGPRGC